MVCFYVALLVFYTFSVIPYTHCMCLSLVIGEENFEENNEKQIVKPTYHNYICGSNIILTWQGSILNGGYISLDA